MSDIDGLEDFDSVVDDVPEIPDGRVPAARAVVEDEDDYLPSTQNVTRESVVVSADTPGLITKPSTMPVRDPAKYLPPELGTQFKKGVEASPVLMPVSDEWVNAPTQRQGEVREPVWRTQIKQVMEMEPRDWGIFYIIMVGSQVSCHALASQLRSRKLKYPAGKFEFVSKNLYPHEPDTKKKYAVLCKYWGPEDD